MSALLHQPTYAPLLPSRAKQLWYVILHLFVQHTGETKCLWVVFNFGPTPNRRIARGTTDGPHWQCVWQELYAVARGKRCLPSSSDEQPSSKRYVRTHGGASHNHAYACTLTFTHTQAAL